MIKINFVISLGVLITFFNVHFAQGADPAVDNAVKDTQELLKNKSQRQEVINRDPKAKAADNQVKAVTGGDTQQSEQIYGISAEIMPALMQSVGNDPAKAMELLQKAQTNPEAFYKSLPPEIRQKIRGVASDIESKNSSKKSP